MLNMTFHLLRMAGVYGWGSVDHVYHYPWVQAEEPLASVSDRQKMARDLEIHRSENSGRNLTQPQMPIELRLFWKRDVRLNSH